VSDLKVHYRIGGGLFRQPAGWVRAVDGVSFEVRRGQTFGLVGESGSGKTTLGRSIVRLVRPRSGSISLDGENLLTLHGRALRRRRRRVQMVFQDPLASLDPRQSVGEALAEPLSVHGLATGRARKSRLAELLLSVGLDPGFIDRHPHQLSGGQLQRVGIARALAVEPDLIVCDEPVSALDVSIQAQVMNLLERLQDQLGLTYVFIAHDLAVVRHISDQLGVMYLGKLVELGPADLVYARPLHPYTVALLSAVPVPDARLERSRRRITLVGDIPSPVTPPSGCRFHTRCWLRTRLGDPEVCTEIEPPLMTSPSGHTQHRVACHFTVEMQYSVETATLIPGPTDDATGVPTVTEEERGSVCCGARGADAGGIPPALGGDSRDKPGRVLGAGAR
jgi:oligopeptide/dipeptide ABC transporter ATP-binding protein